MTVMLLVSCPVAFVYIHEEADRIPPSTVGNVSESTQAPVWEIRFVGGEWQQPDPEATYSKPIEIIARSGTAGARIPYSIGDGFGNVVLPTSNSLEFTEESDPIKLSGSSITRTYTAYAWAPLRTTSAYTTITLATGKLRVESSGFRPAAGRYGSPQTLELLPVEPDDLLYYESTIIDTNEDGNIDEDDVTDPTARSIQYMGEPIGILEDDNSTYCIKVIASRGTNWDNSPVSSACYVRGPTALTFRPVLSRHRSRQILELRSVDPDDVLYYEFATVDRPDDGDRFLNLADVAEPTTASTQYEDEVGISILEESAPIYCIKVIAVGENGTTSKEGCYYRSFARITSLDFTLDGDNANPAGIWSDVSSTIRLDDATMWVVDSVDDKIYAYRMSDGERDSDKEIDELDAANMNPESLYSDGNIIWVDESLKFTMGGEIRNKIFAYNLDGGERQESRDITLTEAPLFLTGKATKIASDGTTLWVVNNAAVGSTVESKANAYALVGGAHVSDKDITFSLPGTIGDIWVNEGTMWALDRARRVIDTYDLSSRLITNDNVAGKNFPTGIITAVNAIGIWSDGTTMWVLDSGSDTILAYNMP